MANTPKQPPVPGTGAPPKQPRVADEDRKYALTVRARARGYYGQIREEGEVFENTLDLSTYPEKETSWIEDAKKKPDAEE